MKTTTSIKAAAIAILHFTFSILHFTAHGAVIQQVIVRQQWPWSTDVKVEYKLAEVTAPVDISVKAFNGDTELPLPAEAMVGDLYGISESGIGQFIIDPVKAFGNQKVAIADFRVELEVTDSAANISEVIYKIFSLTNSSQAEINITRADLLNGKYGSYVTDFSSLGSGFNSSAADVLIWTGVTNNPAYKDTHLVMRKIPAKDNSFMIGSPVGEVGREDASGSAGSETQVSVRFTNDYYMAVFELTQAQYRRVVGASPSSYSGEDAALHPVENVSYKAIRHGGSTLIGPSGEKINWPTNSHPHEVASDSFLASFRTATGSVHEFDLPTSAQWEYACRAGTTTAFNNGKNLPSKSWSANVAAVAASSAWFAETETEAQANNNPTHIVGLKAPNAWGLYDMHGNVGEWCLDHYSKSHNPEGLAELTDPSGVFDSANNRTYRGGSARKPAWNVRSATHSDSLWQGNSSAMVGIRLAFQVGAGE